MYVCMYVCMYVYIKYVQKSLLINFVTFRIKLICANGVSKELSYATNQICRIT
jgi:hypothetical protein